MREILDHIVDDINSLAPPSCLPGRYHACYVEDRADLPFKTDMYGWSSFNHNDCCHLDGASKTDVNFQFTDFSASPCWRRKQWTTSDYLGGIPLHRPAPLIRLLGWSLELSKFDDMHTSDLGVFPYLHSNVIYEVVDSVVALGRTQQSRLDRLYDEYLTFCRAHGLACRMETWTMKRLVIGGNVRSLHCKAKESRECLLFTFMLAQKYNSGSQHDVLREASREEDKHIISFAQCICNMARRQGLRRASNTQGGG